MAPLEPGWGGGGGKNKHLESGIEAQKNWNLGTEKISGIWDMGVLGKFFSTE